MTYNDAILKIAEIAKADGCRVRFYRNKKHFKGFGTGWYLNGNISICLGSKNKKNLMYVMAHETQHHRQWKENKKVFNKYTERDVMLQVEYDAEKRTVKFLKNFDGIKFKEEDYIFAANLYVVCIKWYFLQNCKKWINSPGKISSLYSVVPKRWYTKKELLAPLSEDIIKQIDNYHKIQESKNK